MKIAHNITNWLIKNGAPECNKELYEYGAECLLNEIISDFLLLIFGILTNRILDIIIWLICFTAIRVNLGGYHANNHVTCTILSTLLGCFCVLISPIFIHNVVLILLSIFSFFIIMKIAPVIHKNHPVSNIRQRMIRKVAIFIACIELFLVFIFIKYDARLSSLIFTALFSATLLGFIGAVRNSIHT